MSNPRYPEEFKIQAVNQVTEKKLPVADVAARLGVSTHSLFAFKPLQRGNRLLIEHFVKKRNIADHDTRTA